MYDLQEQSYLLLYAHVQTGIIKKNISQTKIRRWWVFVSSVSGSERGIISKVLPIIRGVQIKDRSSTYEVEQMLITCPLERKVACHGPTYEYCIEFRTNREFKEYLLPLVVRSISCVFFLADVNEFAHSFQNVYGFCVYESRN